MESAIKPPPVEPRKVELGLSALHYPLVSRSAARWIFVPDRKKTSCGLVRARISESRRDQCFSISWSGAGATSERSTTWWLCFYAAFEESLCIWRVASLGTGIGKKMRFSAFGPVGAYVYIHIYDTSRDRAYSTRLSIDNTSAWTRLLNGVTPWKRKDYRKHFTKTSQDLPRLSRERRGCGNAAVPRPRPASLITALLVGLLAPSVETVELLG